MDFFKNLKEDIGTAVGELTSDDDQMVDTLGETDFDEFDLSEEDSTGVDSDMLEKIAMEESLLAAEKEDSVPEVETPVFTEPVEKENMEEKIEEKISYGEFLRLAHQSTGLPLNVMHKALCAYSLTASVDDLFFNKKSHHSCKTRFFSFLVWYCGVKESPN